MANDWYDDEARLLKYRHASADAEVFHVLTRYLVLPILTIAAVGTLVWWLG